MSYWGSSYSLVGRQNDEDDDEDIDDTERELVCLEAKLIIMVQIMM